MQQLLGNIGRFNPAGIGAPGSASGGGTTPVGRPWRPADLTVLPPNRRLGQPCCHPRTDAQSDPGFS